MKQIPASKPAVKTAYETITEPDVSESAFLKVTSGLQGRADVQKTAPASREAALLLNEAQEFQEGRSKRSRELDRVFEAEITTDLERWKRNPDSLDFPGIDTTENQDFEF